jgi:hypothetical protein
MKQVISKMVLKIIKLIKHIMTPIPLKIIFKESPTNPKKSDVIIDLTVIAYYAVRYNSSNEIHQISIHLLTGTDIECNLEHLSSYELKKIKDVLDKHFNVN